MCVGVSPSGPGGCLSVKQCWLVLGPDLTRAGAVTHLEALVSPLTGGAVTAVSVLGHRPASSSLERD